MQIKMIEPKVVMGIPRAAKEVVDVPAGVAREFVMKKWAISEESVKAEALAKSNAGDLPGVVAALSERVATVEETIAGLSERIEGMEETFDIDPELMTGTDVENREADIAKKTATRAADTKKKGK